jgi:hypothetical protein
MPPVPESGDPRLVDWRESDFSLWTTIGPWQPATLFFSFPFRLFSQMVYPHRLEFA